MQTIAQEKEGDQRCSEEKQFYCRILECYMAQNMLYVLWTKLH